MAEPPTNIVSMGDRSNDCRFISLESMLEEALVDARAGRLKGKAVLCVLDKGDSGLLYGTRFRVAQMHASEVVSLLEIMKQRFVAMILP